LAINEHLILTRCLQHLNQLPSLQASCDRDFPPELDGHIRVRSPQESIGYLCEIKTNIKPESIGAVLSKLEYHRQRQEAPLLLLANYLPDNIIGQLIAEKVEFIDTAGNMYLNSPAAYILVRGNRLPKPETTAKSAFTPAGLQLVYSLLQNPNTLNAKYRELTEFAGISLGAVSIAIQNLYNSGHLQKNRAGGYQIVSYPKLLSFWEMGYAEKLRNHLLIGTFTSGTKRSFQQLADDIRQNAAEDYLIGGELGAAIATDYLQPTRATLHAKNHRQVILKLRLRPDPNGEVTILEQFGTKNAWNSDEFTHLVDPLLIHGELLTESNSRLRETASLLFDRFIATRNHDLT
jgi:hypothetical protein